MDRCSEIWSRGGADSPKLHREETTTKLSLQPPDTERLSRRKTNRWHPAHSLPARILYAILGAVLAACVGAIILSQTADDSLLSRHILALSCLVALVFGAVGLRIGASIVEPIEAMTHAVRRIADGERDVVIPLPGIRTGGPDGDPEAHLDELGVLTLCFRDMARRLAHNHQQLEASQREVVEANEKLVSHNDRLHQANEILEQLSITDGLTRLHNHRFFQDTLVKEAKRADRTGEPLALILADIDHFKQWNDRLGHAAGDEILRRIAVVMNALVRETDLLARYGGEEFAILLPNTQVEGAVALAQKVCTTVSETSFVLNPPSEREPLTISLGVASYSGDRKRMFNDADQALYLAKDSGRDCVIVAGSQTLA